MITAPLWRATEAPGHILDMCDVYSNLNLFLQETLESDEKLADFIKCRSTCFDESFIVKDDVYNSLSTEWEKDEITLSLMRHTLIALQQLISRVTEDYLPGGKYHKAQKSKSFRDHTTKHTQHTHRSMLIYR